MLPVAKTSNVFLNNMDCDTDDSHRLKLPLSNAILSVCYPLIILTNRISQNLTTQVVSDHFKQIQTELHHTVKQLDKVNTSDSVKKAASSMCYYYVNSQLKVSHETLWDEYLLNSQALNVPISSNEFEKMIEHCIRYPAEYKPLLELISCLLGLMKLDMHHEHRSFLYEQVNHEINILQSQHRHASNEIPKSETTTLGKWYVTGLIIVNLVGVVWMVGEYFRYAMIDLVIHGWIR
ncbi:MAG: hypothetical protein CMF46_01210 [Legionellales bacterium]|nr:hypothetical protein [Legionellales bacterium]|tara:strand:+ start:159 stop:863 length:705 start_codon:yes stop_codon:yes gene_type:complete